jgi:hypothetical protein
VVYPLLLTWNSNSGAADSKARFALDYSIGILTIAKFPATTGCVVSREYNGRDKVSHFPPAQARTGPGTVAKSFCAPPSRRPDRRRFSSFLPIKIAFPDGAVR